MAASIDTHGTKKVLMLASNPATSEQTGWPIGFWWAELTHPYWEFTEAGYEVTIASPDGGALAGDSFSDPSDESGYSAHDLISRGFIASPVHAALVAEWRSQAKPASGTPRSATSAGANQHAISNGMPSSAATRLAISAPMPSVASIATPACNASPVSSAEMPLIPTAPTSSPAKTKKITAEPMR